GQGTAGRLKGQSVGILRLAQADKHETVRLKTVRRKKVKDLSFLAFEAARGKQSANATLHGLINTSEKTRWARIFRHQNTKSTIRRKLRSNEINTHGWSLSVS